MLQTNTFIKSPYWLIKIKIVLGLKHLHSFIAYLSLAMLLVAIVYTAYCWVTKKPFTKKNRIVAMLELFSAYSISCGACFVFGITTGIVQLFRYRHEKFYIGIDKLSNSKLLHLKHKIQTIHMPATTNHRQVRQWAGERNGIPVILQGIQGNKQFE